MNCKISQLVVSPESKSGPIGKIILSQPSQAEENLLGRLFVVAEIQSRRLDNLVLVDHIVNCLNQNYYTSEELIYLEKTGHATIEGIFENAVTKLNKQISDFLINQHITFSPESASLTIGTIFENKIFFSNIGSNKGILIYEPKNKDAKTVDGFLSINITKNTAEPIREIFDQNKLFSSTVKGLIPLGAAFIFTNESLYEFLDERQLIKIISSLPPAGATKQIKNIIEQSSLFVPFLTLIIKNQKPLIEETYKERPSSADLTPKTIEVKATSSHYYNQENRNQDKNYKHPLSEAIASRRSNEIAPPKDIDRQSIKALNKTEEDTAAILRPTGLFTTETIKKFTSFLDFKKINKIFKKSTIIIERRSVAKKTIISGLKSIFNKIQKIIGFVIGLIIGFFKIITNPAERKALISELKNKKNNLKLKHWLMLGLIIASLIFLIFNIFNLNNKRIEKDRQATITANKKNLDDLFNNLAGQLICCDENAKVIAKNIENEINKLPAKFDDEKKMIEDYKKRLQNSADFLYHLTRLNDLEKIDGVPDNANYLYGAEQYLIIPSGKELRLFDAKNKTSLNATINLGQENCRPLAADSSSGFFNCYTNNKIISVNLKNRAVSESTISDMPADVISGAIWNNRLYLVSGNDKLIYRFNKNGTNYSSKTTWLGGPAELNTIKDLTIDGYVYLLSENNIIKYRSGNRQDFTVAPISPELSADSFTTNSKADTIYILDKKNKRIVALNKKGELAGQYMSDSWNNLKALALSADGKELYVLSDNNVWVVKANQLLTR